MFSIILLIHKIVVFLFLLLLVIKSYYLFTDKFESLRNFTLRSRIANIAVSVLMLLTGIYLWIYSGEIGLWFYVKLVALVLVVPMAVLAFRKNSRVLAGAAVLLLVYVYGISETKSAKFKKARVAKTEELRGGRKIFESYCVSCHGKDGKLGLSGAGDLTKSVISFSEIQEIILKGKTTMPAYKDILNLEQVDEVSKYVESLRAN